MYLLILLNNYLNYQQKTIQIIDCSESTTVKLFENNIILWWMDDTFKIEIKFQRHVYQSNFM